MEILVSPGQYCTTRARLSLQIALTLNVSPIPNMSDNLTLNNVVHHLTSTGVTNAMVGNAHAHAVNWVTATAWSDGEMTYDTQRLHQEMRGTVLDAADTPIPLEPHQMLNV